LEGEAMALELALAPVELRGDEARLVSRIRNGLGGKGGKASELAAAALADGVLQLRVLEVAEEEKAARGVPLLSLKQERYLRREQDDGGGGVEGGRVGAQLG